MRPAADPAPQTDDLVLRATAMEDLSPCERDRRIALAGDKVVDLRAIFQREQEQRRR